MHLILVGLNHKTASVSMREKLYFADNVLPDAYQKLSSYATIKGAVILSTCNRIEIYVASDEIEPCFIEIEQFIESFHGVTRNEFFPHIYRKHCEDAVSHLFKVAASLDSMVVGEYQIQGQLRDAYTRASEKGYTNNLTNKIFQTAIQVGKAIRTDTGIGKGSVSIASVAVDLVQDLFKDSKSYTLLIIGAGKMAALAAQNLSQLKECKVTVCNRTIEKAEELAKRFNAEMVHYDNRHKAINESDIIIVSTGADDFIINKDDLTEFCSNNTTEKKKFLIDISLPRNIDPEINELDNIILYSLDELQEVIAANLGKRSLEIEKTEKIIAKIALDYYEWYAKQEIMPIMQQLKQNLEVIKTRTLEANKTALTQFDNTQQQAIVTILDYYSEKLIKAIMKNMKMVADKDELRRIAQSLKNSFTITED
jgi:glutamyl-tRNA reductase